MFTNEEKENLTIEITTKCLSLIDKGAPVGDVLHVLCASIYGVFSKAVKEPIIGKE